MKKILQDMPTVQWVEELGPPRLDYPPLDVIDAIESRTGFSLRELFSRKERVYTSEQKQNIQAWSFFRSVDELEAIIRYGNVPIEQFAPFAASYGIESKRSAKKSNISRPICVYGVCFAGQFADPTRILAWDGDRDYVHAWATIEEFINTKI